MKGQPRAGYERLQQALKIERRRNPRDTVGS